MNRRRSTIKRAKWKKGDKQALSTGVKGPGKTEPVHGKKNRVAYDAGIRESKWQLSTRRDPKDNRLMW